MNFLTFGEIMLRLTPFQPGERIKTSNLLNVSFAGSESNVAASLSQLGHNACFITKLPNNDIGDACEHSLLSYGIDTSGILRTEGRLGTYFIELGSSIRPSKVIYDREGSLFSKSHKGDFDWDHLLEGVSWLFASGITAALTENCRELLLELLAQASKKNVKVAFDMNYRRTLWKGSSEARVFFEKAIPHIYLLLGNTGAINDIYDDQVTDTEEAIRVSATRFGIDELCFTDRKHHSASHNDLQGFIHSQGEIYKSKPLSVDIKDRLGTGDAFAAGCLHGYAKNWSPEEIINFGTAAFALKHTIIGDQHTSSENEIMEVVEGKNRGHVIR